MQINKNKLLIVEGEDEKNFFESYFRHKGINDIQILPIGGKTKLRINLELVINDDNFSALDSIGIMRDADDDPKEALSSVQGDIRHNGFTPPQSHLTDEGENPKWVIYIVPDKDRVGALENLCLESVNDDCAMEHIEEFYDNLKENDCQYPDHENKSKVLCFLSSRKIYTNHLGLAAHKRIWDFNSAAFDKIVELLDLL